MSWIAVLAAPLLVTGRPAHRPPAPAAAGALSLLALGVAQGNGQLDTVGLAANVQWGVSESGPYAPSAYVGRLLARETGTLRPLSFDRRSRTYTRSIALCLRWRHYGAMPSIQIKDVPDDAHAVLKVRAAAAGQSLQEYLRGRLIEEAGAPTVEEVLARAGGRAGGSLPFSAAALSVEQDRARR